MKRFYFPYLFVFFIALLPVRGFSQDELHHDDHNHDDHIHAPNEISIGAGLVYLPAENEFGPGINLHYIRGLGQKRIYGAGFSVEAILDEHRHIFLAVVHQVHPVGGLKASYAPGILLGDGDDEPAIRFAHHVELTYEFEIGKINLGPVFGVGQAGSDLHVMLGLHGGVHF